MGLMFAVEANRTVSVEKGTWVQVQKLDVPDEGLMVWLRNFGLVKLFRTRLKDQLRHYVVCLLDADDYNTFGRGDFQRLHDQHWKIEQYHRMLKQVCNIERFQVRGKVPILKHIFEALSSFVALQEIQFRHAIVNACQLASANCLPMQSPLLSKGSFLAKNISIHTFAWILMRKSSR